MLIVLLDEPGLFVFPSVAAAERVIEPYDAESRIRAAFDDSAVPYRVEWLRPNQHTTTLFGLLKSVTDGEYHLVPAGPADPSALIRVLEEHPGHTNPREAQSELAKLLVRLRAATHANEWSVWRQDDNGNRFEVARGLPSTDAARQLEQFEALGHKQTYWLALTQSRGD